MPRRAYCESFHDWHIVGEGKEACRKCPATFPCNYNCGHFDCTEARNKLPVCPVCHKPVKEEDTLFMSQGVRFYAVHNDCSSKFNTNEEEEAA